MSIRRQDPNNYSDTETRALSNSTQSPHLHYKTLPMGSDLLLKWLVLHDTLWRNTGFQEFNVHEIRILQILFQPLVFHRTESSMMMTVSNYDDDYLCESSHRYRPWRREGGALETYPEMGQRDLRRGWFIFNQAIISNGKPIKRVHQCKNLLFCTLHTV